MAKTKIDKRVYRRVAEIFVRIACDSNGQPINGKALDRVMYDILGQEDFFTRICNIRRDAELPYLFNGCNFMEIVSVVENERQLDVLRGVIELNKEIFSLKKKIKRLTKKGKKCKGLRDRHSDLNKIYKKAIKAFRDLLNVKNPSKANKPSKKYSNVINFSKKINGSNGIYDQIFGGDFDYDDDEEFFGGGYEDDLLVDRNRNRVYRGINPTNIFEDEDLEDFDDEDDEDTSNVEDQLEELRDLCSKNLTALGSIISLFQNNPNPIPDGGAQILPHIPATINGNVNIDVEEDDDDEDDTEDRLDSLEKIVIGMCDKIDSIIDTRDNRYLDQYAEAEKQMSLLFNGDETEDYGSESIDPDTMSSTITAVSSEEKDYSAMDVAEVIEEKNAHNGEV